MIYPGLHMWRIPVIMVNRMQCWSYNTWAPSWCTNAALFRDSGPKCIQLSNADAATFVSLPLPSWLFPIAWCSTCPTCMASCISAEKLDTIQPAVSACMAECDLGHKKSLVHMSSQFEHIEANHCSLGFQPFLCKGIVILTFFKITEIIYAEVLYKY